MKLIRIFIFFMIAVIMTSFGDISYADGTKPIYKVGYIPSTGFFREDWPGHFSGYGYEFMQSLGNYAVCDFEYVPVSSWEDGVAALQSGAVDVMPGMPGDPKKTEGIVRTDHVIGRLSMALILHSGLTKNDFKIGIYERGFSTPHLSEIARREGFTYTAVTFSSREDMEAAFNRGELDGYVDIMLAAKAPAGCDVPAFFDRQSYRLVVKKGRDDLLRQMNEGMDMMLMTQPDIRAMLLNKYIRGDGGLPLTLSREEREYLKEKGKLTAMMFADRKPISYEENGEAKGVVPDIMRMIANDLGVDLEIIIPESQEEGIIYLRAGKVDFLANLYADFSWAKTLNLNMTAPYLIVDYVPVTRKNGRTSEDASIACPQTLFYIQADLIKLYGRNRLRYFPDAESCLKGVSDGSADMTYLPSVMADYIKWNGDYYNLSVGSDTAFSHSLSLGVCHNADPRLLTILNKEINQHLDRTQIHGLMRQAAEAKEVSFSISRIIYLYPYHSVAAIIMLAIVLGCAYKYRNDLNKRHLEEKAELGRTDQRTGLPNLTRFEEDYQEIINAYPLDYQSGRFYAVLMVIEPKALLSETEGRELFTKRIKEIVESLDKKPWVVLAGVDRAHPIALCRIQPGEEIKTLMAEFVAENGFLATSEARIWLDPKVGICPLRENGFTLLQAISRADTAAHEISGQKENVKLFDDKLRDEIAFKQKIENSMEGALKAGEFQAWYQPKYDIATKKQVGAETLVRWISPEMGFLPPGKFVPLLENNGFVIQLDYFLLRATCELQQRRIESGLPVVPISVNMSRLHLTEDGYLEKMQAITDEYHLPQGTVELELTETVFGDVDDSDQRENAIRVVRALRGMGYAMSVDDFGSGYSSFTMLNYLPMDVMKLDRSLLDVSEDSARMRTILSKVIKLGEELHMKVLCEGIETPDQEELLLELGCHYGQGFLNGKPMPEGEFEKFLAEKNGWPA